MPAKITPLARRTLPSSPDLNRLRLTASPKQSLIVSKKHLDWHPRIIHNFKSCLDTIQSCHIMLGQLPPVQLEIRFYSSWCHAFGNDTCAPLETPHQTVTRSTTPSTTTFVDTGYLQNLSGALAGGTGYFRQYRLLEQWIIGRSSKTGICSTVYSLRCAIIQ